MLETSLQILRAENWKTCFTSTERSLRLIFLEQNILPNLLLLSLITEEMLRMPWTAEMAIDLTVVD
jgi:hypothetical protein